MLGGACLGDSLAGGVDSCRVMAGSRERRRGVEGIGVGVEGEGGGEGEEDVYGGVRGVVGVCGSGRLEAIWTSWSSSAGSGDVVEAAAVSPTPIPTPSLSSGLSPLTASRAAASLIELVCECTNSSTSDGRALSLGRRPSIYSVFLSCSQPFCSAVLRPPVVITCCSCVLETAPFMQTKQKSMSKEIETKCEMRLCNARGRRCGLRTKTALRTFQGW